MRARIVLDAASGKKNVQIAADLDVHPDTVGRWRKQFQQSGLKGLRDAPRSGRPPAYSPEVKVLVLNKATQWPRENGVPVTHWSGDLLARLVSEAGITGSIHRSTVARWLNDADLKPHRVRYWLKSTDPDFDARMNDVVGVYRNAIAWAKEGHKIFCVDEKTGLQALERKHPGWILEPGKPARREHEYKRHGTTCLTAAFDVATGEVSGILTATRPATQFAAFVKRLCDENREAFRIHIVLDQLNTHWHHEVCKMVAEASGTTYDPAQHTKGPSRRLWLCDENKRVVFHFTPKHASWLNQVEIWFSTLSRKALARGSFSSVDDLETKVLAFIDYYNRVLARPYKWTYTGTPCKR